MAFVELLEPVPRFAQRTGQFALLAQQLARHGILCKKYRAGRRQRRDERKYDRVGL